MPYTLNIDGVLEARLRRLAKLARQQPAGEDATFTQAFEYLLTTVQQSLRDDGHYHLSQELRVATYRWLKRDPFAITKLAKFQINCLHQPALFADFLEQELLDADNRHDRERRARSAGAWGYSPYGLTQEEMRATEDRFFQADMQAAEDMFEEARFNDLVEEACSKPMC